MMRAAQVLRDWGRPYGSTSEVSTKSGHWGCNPAKHVYYMYTMYTFEICIEIHRIYLHTWLYMLMYTHKVRHAPSLVHVPKTSPTRMNKWGKNCTWLLLSVPDRGLHKIRKDMWHFSYCKFCKLCTWSFQSEEFSSLFALLHYLHYSHFLRQNSTILRKIELSWTIHIPLPSPSSGSFPPKCGVHSIVLHCYTMSEIILNWTWYIPKLQ